MSFNKYMMVEVRLVQYITHESVAKIGKNEVVMLELGQDTEGYSIEAKKGTFPHDPQMVGSYTTITASINLGEKQEGNSSKDDWEFWKRLVDWDEVCSDASRHRTLWLGLTWLVSHYHGYLCKVAFDIVHDYATAEDIVQQSLAQVVITMRYYTKQTLVELHTRSWLCTIVRNEALDYLRRQRQVSNLKNCPEAFEMEGSQFDKPEKVVAYDEGTEMMNAILEELPSTYRKIIEMRVLEELPYRAIAEKLGYEIGTLRTVMHRATKSFERVVKRRQIRENELRMWLEAYGFNKIRLEEPEFSLRRYIGNYPMEPD